MIYLVIILPVFLSGLTFIIILKLFGENWLSFPLDSGLKFKNKRLLGKNKTIKGPIIMMFFTGLYGWSIIKIFKIKVGGDLPDLILFLYYSLVGLSYSLGELPNSFLKRQLSIPPGEVPKEKVKMFIFKTADVFDSLIACGITYFLLFQFPSSIIFNSILLGGLIHFLTDQLMIFLKLKK